MDDEQRTRARAVVSLETRWSGMSGNYEARVCDISAGGCFIESIGQATRRGCELRPAIATGEWRELEGKVAFTDPFMGFGLRFLNLSSEDQTLIAELVKTM